MRGIINDTLETTVDTPLEDDVAVTVSYNVDVSCGELRDVSIKRTDNGEIVDNLSKAQMDYIIEEIWDDVNQSSSAPY